MSARHSLSDLVVGLVDVPGSIQVDDLTLQSRHVSRNGLFLACQGRRTHGLQGLNEALERGARAVLWEPAAGVTPPDAQALTAVGAFAAPVTDLSRHAGQIAARFFDDPSSALQICGITGTNGKTTTAWLSAKFFELLDMSGGYIGTIGAGRVGAGRADAGRAGEGRSGAKLETTDLTTADAVGVQRQLATLRLAGAQHVALEVSSHALDQYRVDAVRLQVAAFTNLSRDHLDYHGTMQAYGACKSRLMTWPNLRGRVINVDDALGRELAKTHVSSEDCRLVLTSRSREGHEFGQQLKQARSWVTLVRGSALQPSSQGMRFSLAIQQGEKELSEYPLIAPLLGDFNIDNLLITLGILHVFNADWGQVLARIGEISAPPGRMEAMSAPGKPLTIVDYAHTPDALHKALSAARVHCTGRLQVVFGCGGERDRGKRSLMGRVAALAADDITLTDDNPRGESPAEIIDEIRLGIVDAGKSAPKIIHDRREAIREAVRSAREGDVVLVAGKGHEDYQIFGNQRFPASDRDWVREALQS